MTKKVFHFRITDHVLLRYMERMLGVDVADFRRRLHDKLKPAAEAGAAQIEMGGMVFKFAYGPNDATVTTMWPIGHVAEKQRPPMSGDDSKEAKHIQARKRMAK